MIRIWDYLTSLGYHNCWDISGWDILVLFIATLNYTHVGGLLMLAELCPQHGPQVSDDHLQAFTTRAEKDADHNMGDSISIIRHYHGQKEGYLMFLMSTWN